MKASVNQAAPTTAVPYGRGTRFRLWSPEAKAVCVVADGKRFAMWHEGMGYWSADAEGVGEGSLYRYEVDGKTPRPDPCSFHQPQGVHGPSRVVDTRRFAVAPLPALRREALIFYELHVGTFTPEGTFAAAAEKIPHLKALGVTAVELMPVAAFPGTRNWGYDGVYPYAVQESYGGPDGLASFVDRCHREGIAVFLDVVYNHLGPEGNYLREFAPYFTPKYATPWGDAVNLDGEYSYGVRKYFIDNALHWFSNYDIDGLRIDAIHGIFDTSAKHFLQELAESVHDYSLRSGKLRFLVAESDLNDRRTVDPAARNGFGLDAQWLEDFHHALHANLTGEAQGYYADFAEPGALGDALNAGFVYGWRYSRYRKRFFGSDTADIDPSRFVAFVQNHDQVGNRAEADRLSLSLGVRELKLAAGMLLLSPYLPLLFMGEEYGERAPFHYFIDHGDEALVEAVRRGRAEEFKAFGGAEQFCDPQSEAAFQESKLRWGLEEQEPGATLYAFYRRLIRFRREHPAYRRLRRPESRCFMEAESELLTLQIRSGEGSVAVLFNLGGRQRNVEAPPAAKAWRVELDSDAFDGGDAPDEAAKIEGGAMLRVAPKSFLLLCGGAS